MTRAERLSALAAAGRRRILLLDGAMGTALQDLKLDEAGYRGAFFAGWPSPVKGNNDLLNLTQPAAVRGVHEAYLEAGADILETNTFTATAIAQADYGMADLAPEIAAAGARLARQAADAFSARTPAQPRLVAGAIGPLNKTLSLSPDVNDPAHRDVDFDQVYASYRQQAEAMIDDVDMFLIETVFDTLNAKAAIAGVLDVREARAQEEVALLVSGTITDRSGRTLSGQTTEAFWNSIRHARPWAVGLNCALGAEDLRQYVAELARVADARVLAYPNAGLPNAFGEYDETPDVTAGHLGEWAQAGLVNVLGGCCGTTPAHIKAIAAAIKDAPPRVVRERPVALRLSGLEPFEVAG